MGSKYEHWGVVVKPGETVKCDPGRFYCVVSQIALQAGKGNENVEVFVEVGGKRLLIGTLSVDRHPQYTIELVFEKEFELLHTSKTSNISVIGYKFSECERKYPYVGGSEDYDSDSEEGESSNNKDSSNEDDVESSDEDIDSPKNVEVNNRPAETPLKTAPEKKEKRTTPSKGNITGCDEDDVESSDEDEESPENDKGKNRPAETTLKTPPEKEKITTPSKGNNTSSDEDDVESSDEDEDSPSPKKKDEDSPKNVKGKNRPAETPLKTPPEKKAKITPPSKRRNTGSCTGKKSVHVHVATPYPSSKHVKKTPSTSDNPKQPTGYACKSCSKTFNSYIALKTHCKVKKHVAYK
uniref:Hdt102 n=1 Tax=Arundo donax TaxID=35708 RepID=A0A0A9H363_ARUDO